MGVGSGVVTAAQRRDTVGQRSAARVLICCAHMLRSHAVLTCCARMLYSHAALTCCAHMLYSHAALACCAHMLRSHAALCTVGHSDCSQAEARSTIDRTPTRAESRERLRSAARSDAATVALIIATYEVHAAKVQHTITYATYEVHAAKVQHTTSVRRLEHSRPGWRAAVAHAPRRAARPIAKGKHHRATGGAMCAIKLCCVQ